jgi:hypothetical protein
MNNKSKPISTRVVPAFSGSKRRFVKTKLGEAYCVEWLVLKGEELTELECYRFDDYGTRFNARLKPGEVQDLSEIHEILGSD